MSPEGDFIGACETHSVEAIERAIDAGLDPRGDVQGKPLTSWLTEMYFRSDRFAPCLRLLLDRGAKLDDPRIAPVLLDDADKLRAAIRADPTLVRHRTTMRSSFTPLEDATLLHVAAEYGQANVCRVLLELGADVEARAAVDSHGLGGHTPIFHTVNSNQNRSVRVLEMLLKAGARTDVVLSGIVWGKSFEWETVFFDVTPIAYAQLGLLPQMHREARHIHANVVLMLEAARRAVPPFVNVPNRYLQPRDKR